MNLDDPSRMLNLSQVCLSAFNPVFSGFRQNPVFGPKTRFWGKTGKKPRTRTGKRNPVLNLDKNRVFSRFRSKPGFGAQNPVFEQNREKTRFSCRGQNPVSENPGSKPGFKTRKKPGFGPKPGFFLVLRGRGCVRPVSPLRS